LAATQMDVFVERGQFSLEQKVEYNGEGGSRTAPKRGEWGPKKTTDRNREGGP